MSTWIFLRGLTRESRHWGDFPEVFRETIADAEIITLDLPGNGHLHLMESPLCVEQMADYCHAEMLVRGLQPPYFLLAMSLGAMVAVDWARRYSNEISGCVLVNTSLRPVSPFYQRLRPRVYPVLLKHALFGGTPHEWEATILKLTSHLADDRALILDTWSALRRECPVTRRNALRQLWAASRYRIDARPAVRMLILASVNDGLVDSRCSRQLALRWGAELSEHPEAGHDIPLDDGPWVAKQVRDWLATASSSG